MKTRMSALLITTVLSLTFATYAAPDAVASSPKSASAASKKKAYPLKTCIVTDNDLDSMGGEIVKIYDGQEIKFCCKPCVKKFEKDQAKYLKKIK